MRVLERLWGRYDRRRPRSYRLYVRLPTEFPDRSLLGAVSPIVDEITRACDGRVDVYGTADGLVVTADAVPAESFDESTFEACLEDVEALYEGTYALAVVKKWGTGERLPCRSYVAVPVKPLFPRAAAEPVDTVPAGPTDR
ncbi:hypothetical protein ACFQGT_04615 [Natrialbaceae archaeon GCM10025810]|uniref:hypothetical protein n=1 Tax=Halovalidus salilacus TaxID=3075124 RepID=UPI00361A03EA